MTKIEISEGDLAETAYRSESDEGSETRAGKPNISDWAWRKVRSKRITQLLGAGIVLGLILWAAYIVASRKKFDSVDVITFELTITVIVCVAIAVHLRRSSVR
jgi:hypothetical protein